MRTIPQTVLTGMLCIDLTVRSNPFMHMVLWMWWKARQQYVAAPVIPSD